MKNSIIYALLLTLISFQVNATQSLPRKAWLGAQIEPYQTEGIQGMRVLYVAGGTAASLQLQVNDIILAIDGTQLNDYTALQAALSGKRENQPTTIKILRDKKKLTVRGKYSGRPLETHEISEVIYDEAPYKKGRLRVIINKPNVAGIKPAMLFIPGYTCVSIDNLDAIHPNKRIIDEFIAAGFVTLRIEKSGLGDSENTPPCESCDLLDEIENFEAGLLKLKSLPYVDTSQIIIFGHSMGGIIAPALSARHQVAGVIVYGTTAKSWFEYQIEMYRVQNELAGLDPISHEASVREQYELNYRFFVKKESLEEMAAETYSDSILRNVWQYDGNGKIYSRNAEYWRQIQDVSHLENWKNTNARVLVQFGESDFQAFSKADHEQIVKTVNYYNPENASLLSFANTDHYFAKSGTMQEAFDKFSNRQYKLLFQEYNYEVGRSAVEWSKSVIRPKKALSE